MQTTFDQTDNQRVDKGVRIWLLIGLVMVFFQVMIGGVTRLTDSGLSITEWAVIQGTLPPMNATAWQEAFAAYKTSAQKQFESLHQDMTLSEFKVIFFWEYFHRLWARLMGFVFIIPFFYFFYKKRIPKWLLKDLGIVILLAALAATFGWIMVASGLNDDNRTWVSAYKLMTHLGIATLLFGYLFWTWLKTRTQKRGKFVSSSLYRLSVLVSIAVFVQILLGGLMAGMRAGLVHPYFPIFVHFDRFQHALLNAPMGLGQLINYEGTVAVKAWVQLFHRLGAYLLSGLIIFFVFKSSKVYNSTSILSLANKLLITLLVIQLILGILTLINCFGEVPIVYATAHQSVALLLLLSCLFSCFQLRYPST